MSETGGDHISANISGDVSGQIAVGRDISQAHHVSPSAPVTDAELVQLQQLFADLKAQLVAEVPPAQQEPALERFEELEEALTAEEPDLGTAAYVKRWFLRKLPSFAGLVSAVLVNPIVGKLVQSAGDVAVAELDRLSKE